VQEETGDGASTSGRTFEYLTDMKDAQISSCRILLLADPKDPTTFTEAVLVGVAGDGIIVFHRGEPPECLCVYTNQLLTAVSCLHLLCLHCQTTDDIAV
jgi:hypothetical protein